MPENKLTPKIKAERERLARIEAKEKAERERFTIRSSTFVDNKTGYMWEKPKKDNHMTWQNAKDYCENLNLDGYSDWRLPSRNELKTLFDNNKHKRNNFLFLPKEISGMFSKNGYRYSWFWTRNIRKTYNSYSWIVRFFSGHDYWGNQTLNGFVVCVRDL